ncbi:HAMP domain-containing sensor histidine kinase [Isoptericola sp. b490]|uniref:sensor histidine kinase n=1 Tax=Actinotalea lenta TaxID=3064654 RepID=UPI0027130621|nr:HAMP domain-containing sensor histidine kinase [Isoptericola sp. b490]MDO8119856.1 HAMP domain-containing sensor histidine kinase [Isoptericola sp. b490]
MSPALRRIRVIRWTTTGVFAITTAACLTVLVVLALRVDSTSRLRSLTDGLANQASILGEVITYTDGSLDLSRLQQTQDLRIAPVVGVVTSDAIAYAAPDQSALPADAELRRVLRQVTDNPGVTSFTAPQASGAELHWAAAPVIGVSPQGVGVQGAVLVGGPVPGAAEHARLALALALTAVALVALAAALGHVISGFAMRPAVRGLADQERFLVEASHELRTPLAVLAVQLDEARAGGEDALGRARRQVDRLAAITSALLLRARASAGTTRVTREPLRLDQLVESVLGEAVPEALADGRVVLDAPPVVVDANPELVSHAVRNLVDNALRHGAPPVTVALRPGEIEVSDTGPGIPVAQRRRMQRPGVGRGEGTGTGLAIVAWVARVHGGRLVLDSAPGGGLRAVLRW